MLISTPNTPRRGFAKLENLYLHFLLNSPTAFEICQSVGLEIFVKKSPTCFNPRNTPESKVNQSVLIASKLRVHKLKHLHLGSL